MASRRPLALVALMAATLILALFVVYLKRPAAPPAASPSTAAPAAPAAEVAVTAVAASEPSVATDKTTPPPPTPAPPAEYRVMGRVLMPDGSPAEGATVSLDWRGGLEQPQPGEARADLKTGADGAFDLRIPSKFFLLHAAKAGYASVSIEGRIRQGNTYQQDLTLGTEARLAGRVVRREGGTDTPLAGVVVETLRFDDNNPRNPDFNEASYQATTTDAAGQFILAGLQFGDHLVRARLADGGALSQTAQATNEAMLFAFEPDTFAEVSGIVVDAAGAPVVGAQITYNPAKPSDANRVFAFSHSAQDGYPIPTSQADGSFSIPGIERGMAVRVGARADAATTRQQVRVTAGVDSTGLRLVLQGGWTIHGLVVDANTGEPLAGVSIKEQQIARISGIRQSGNQPGTVVETGNDGRFVFEVPPAQSSAPMGGESVFTLVATKPGWIVAEGSQFSNGQPLAPLDTFHVGLPVDQSSVDVTVKMATGTSLSGTVRREDGQPIKSGHISASARRGVSDREVAGVSVATTMRIATLAADGSFRMLVPSDLEYVLTAEVDGYGRHGGPRVMAKPPAIDGIEIILPALSNLEGSVLDRDDKPVEGAEVSLADNAQKKATTDAEGRFRLEGVPPSRVRLTTEATGYATASLVVPDVQPGTTVSDVKIVLDKTTAFGGRVVDHEGNPVAGAQLELIPGEGQSGLSLGEPTGQDGRFLKDEVPSKPYLNLKVRVGAENYTFKPSQYAIGRIDNELVLEARNTCTVIVSVVDKLTQLPVKGLELLDKTSGIVAEVEDGELGILRIEGVSPRASFSFKVQTPDHPAQSIQGNALNIPATIEPGAVIARTVELQGRRSARGRVIRASDKTPVEGVKISLRIYRLGMPSLDTSPLESATSNERGEFELSNVPNTGFALDLEPPSPLADTRVVMQRMVQDPVIDLGDITLSEGATLRVRLVDDAGMVQPGVPVTLLGDGGSMGYDLKQTITTNAQGMAEFPGLSNQGFILRVGRGELTVDPGTRSTGIPTEVITIPIGSNSLRVAVLQAGKPIRTPFKVNARRSLSGGIQLSCTLTPGPPQGEQGWRIVTGLSAGTWSVSPHLSRQQEPKPPEFFREQDAQVGPSTIPELVFTQSAGGISGRVMDMKGQPIPAARVQYGNTGLHWETRADQSGAFSIEDLPPGTYKLRGYDNNGSFGDESGIEVTNERMVENVVLLVKPLKVGRLHVVARDANSGQLLTISNVFVSEQGRPIEVTESRQEDGSWVFENMREGTFDVLTRVGGLSQHGAEVTVVGNQTTTLETTHAPVGNLDWTLLDEDQRPVQGWVEFEAISPGMKVPFRRLPSNSRHIETGLAVGKYRGGATRDGRLSSRERVYVEFEIRANETTRLRTVVPAAIPSPTGTPSP